MHLRVGIRSWRVHLEYLLRAVGGLLKFAVQLGGVVVQRGPVCVVAKGLQCAYPAVAYLTCLTISNDGETSRCTNTDAVPEALQLSALLDDHHAAALCREQLRLLLI